MSQFAIIKVIIDKLPEGLNADWDGTNHYELSSNEEPFWLDIRDAVLAGNKSAEAYLPGTEDGKRLGLVMDAASVLKNEVPKLMRAYGAQRELLKRILALECLDDLIPDARKLLEDERKDAGRIFCYASILKDQDPSSFWTVFVDRLQRSEDPLIAIATQAETDPELKKLYPYMSHASMGLSRKATYPYTADMPFITANNDGTFKLQRGDQSLIGDGLSAGAAIAIIKESIPGSVED